MVFVHKLYSSGYSVRLSRLVQRLLWSEAYLLNKDEKISDYLFLNLHLSYPVHEFQRITFYNTCWMVCIQNAHKFFDLSKNYCNVNNNQIVHCTNGDF